MDNPKFEAALEETVTDRGSGYYDDFQRCPRSWGLVQVQLIELRTPRTNKNFEIGKLCHAVLRYAGCAEVAREDWSNWDKLLDYAVDVRGVNPEHADAAAMLMQHYFVHYGTDNAGYPASAQIIQIEHEWRAEFGGLEVSGRADTLLEIEGEIYIVDHKTRSTKFPDDAAREFAIRPQFLRMCALWRKLNSDAPRAQIWVNGLIKTKLPSFERKLVRIDDTMLDAWEENQLRLAKVLVSPEIRGMLPANFGSCHGVFGDECWARDWCWGSENLRNKKYRRKLNEIECIAQES